MAAKRVIPCLDVKDGRVVKGVKFQNLRDMGRPSELACRYDLEGADEVVFLDISATDENRATQETWVREVAHALSIPFTVGGGVGSVEDVRRLLRAGADKVGINTAAVKNPQLIAEAAAVFGRQCIVVAIDAARDPELGWRVFINGGKKSTDLDAVAWMEQVTELGAGEILLTSIDRDGTLEGFDLELLQKAGRLSIPVIASGGAGKESHFLEALQNGADAVLAATLFHEGTLPIPKLKAFLAGHGVSVPKVISVFDIDQVKFDEKGLVPGIVQTSGGEVRMLAYLNRESLERTVASGFVTFWSRSRKELWTKGETSGNCLKLVELRLDCDGDALLILAEPEGPTCHRGTDSCFEGDPLPQPWLERLEDLLRQRKATASAEGSYTQKLFVRGVDRIGKKVVEEAGEVVIGAKNFVVEPSEFNRTEFLGEAADLLFHLQMLLVSQGFSLQDAALVLRERHRQRS